jgi:thiol:disulfide interchange protein DsbA
MQRRSFLLGVTGFFLTAALPSMGLANEGNGGGQRSLVEVFSFTCPHCYKLSGQMQAWIAIHGNVKHFAVHIITSADDLKLSAAGYAAAVLGKGDEYRQAFFKAIHEQQKTADERTMIAVAESLGFKGAAFVETMRGEKVAELCARSETITKNFQITATPTLIIDMQRVRLPDRDPLEILTEEFGQA